MQISPMDGLDADCAAAWAEQDAEAAARLEGRLAALREAGEALPHARACLGVAMVRWACAADPTSALACVEDALSWIRFEDAPAAWLRLANFAIFLQLESEAWVEAIPLALAVRRQASLVENVDQAHNQATANLAWALWQLGDLDRAEGLYEECIAPGREGHYAGQAMGDLIALRLARGDQEGAEALRPALESMAMAEPRRQDVVAVARARLDLAAGRWEAALAGALGLLDARRGLPEEQTALRAVAAEALLGLGRPQAALQQLEAGLAQLEGRAGPVDPLLLLRLKAHAHHALGQHDQTLEVAEEMGRRELQRVRRSVGRGLTDALHRFDEELRHLRTIELETRARSLERSNAALDAARRAAEAALQAREAREEQLRQATILETAARLGGNVGHEINNLLTVVLGSIEALNLSEEAALQSPIRHIAVASERMRAAVGRLMLLTGQQPRGIESTDLDRHITAAHPQLLAGLREEQTLELDLQAPGTTRLGPTEIDQLIGNLVANASAAMGPAGRLRLSTRAFVHPSGADWLRLELADDGVGIDAEKLARIFEPFYTSQRLGRGLGLGLTLCRVMVENAGGHIEARSRPGQGTTLRIDLPLQARVDAPALLAPAAGNLPVLLVEDEDLVRRSVAGMLRRSGLDVVEAEDGQAGLAAWQQLQGRVRLVVSDVLMPRMNGMELARAILAEAPDQPIVLMSGYTARQSLEALLQRPNLRFLPKPFSPDDLRALLE